MNGSTWSFLEVTLELPGGHIGSDPCTEYNQIEIQCINYNLISVLSNAVLFMNTDWCANWGRTKLTNAHLLDQILRKVS